MKRWKDMNKDEKAKVLAVAGVAIGGIAVGVGGCMTAKYLGKMINNAVYPNRGLMIKTIATGDNHEKFRWLIGRTSKSGKFFCDYSGTFDTHDGAINLFKELIQDAEEYKAQIGQKQFNEAINAALESTPEEFAKAATEAGMEVTEF